MLLNPYGGEQLLASQKGTGRGSSIYADYGKKGKGEYRDIGIGPFRIPFGTYQGPEY